MTKSQYDAAYQEILDRLAMGEITVAEAKIELEELDSSFKS